MFGVLWDTVTSGTCKLCTKFWHVNGLALQSHRLPWVRGLGYGTVDLSGKPGTLPCDLQSPSVASWHWGSHLECCVCVCSSPTPSVTLQLTSHPFVRVLSVSLLLYLHAPQPSPASFITLHFPACTGQISQFLWMDHYFARISSTN